MQYILLLKICKKDEIKNDSIIVHSTSKIDILVGKIKGRLFACNNSCPHRGASLSKGNINGNNIVCYMHGYEYNVFTGKLEDMKSWKKEDAWIEQSDEWRKSDDLTLYEVIETDGWIYVKI